MTVRAPGAGDRAMASPPRASIWHPVPMAIDFTLTPELEELRLRIRTFVAHVIKPGEDDIEGHGDAEPLSGRERITKLIELRKQAHAAGLRFLQAQQMPQQGALVRARAPHDHADLARPNL